MKGDYIITSESKMLHRNDGSEFGMSGKRVLHYDSTIGRRRIYRQSETPVKGMKVLTYKNKENAQKTCDNINNDLNEDFKVESI